MNLNINTGDITLTINDDPSRVIKFNPSDIRFTDSFYALLQKFSVKEAEFKRAVAEIDKDASVDKFGIDSNAKKQIDLIRNVCEFMNEQIDDVFGEGTSTAAFDGSLSLDNYIQFFEGVTPFIKKVRDDKVSKYLNKPKAGVLK